MQEKCKERRNEIMYEKTLAASPEAQIREGKLRNGATKNLKREERKLSRKPKSLN